MADKPENVVHEDNLALSSRADSMVRACTNLLALSRALALSLQLADATAPSDVTKAKEGEGTPSHGQVARVSTRAEALLQVRIDALRSIQHSRVEAARRVEELGAQLGSTPTADATATDPDRM